MNYSHMQKNKGFTLIEMLIAVLIFSLSLAALMTISSRGMRISRDAQDQVVADYLALEGIEAVRNIRDSVLLRQLNIPTWVNVFDVDGCLSDEMLAHPGSGCVPILPVTATQEIELHPCNHNNCHRVFYNPTTYRYHQFQDGVGTGSTIPTQFYRRIKLIPVPQNNKEMIVRVIVTWDGGRRVVDYTENLFLWLSL